MCPPLNPSTPRIKRPAARWQLCGPTVNSAGRFGRKPNRLCEGLDAPRNRPSRQRRIRLCHSFHVHSEMTNTNTSQAPLPNSLSVNPPIRTLPPFWQDRACSCNTGRGGKEGDITPETRMRSAFSHGSDRIALALVPLTKEGAGNTCIRKLESDPCEHARHHRLCFRV